MCPNISLALRGQRFAYMLHVSGTCVVRVHMLGRLSNVNLAYTLALHSRPYIRCSRVALPHTYTISLTRVSQTRPHV